MSSLRQRLSRLRSRLAGLSPERNLSSKLSLALLLLAAPIFVASLGVLFTQSRRIIRLEALGRVNSVINTAMQNVVRNLITVETATNANAWLAAQSLQPDSLLALSYRMVRRNPNVDGCSISTEPGLFPQYGTHFSAYTIRKADSITTVIEEPYDYFEKIWYKTPRVQGSPCWVAFYDETDSLLLTIDGMIASYCLPLYDNAKRFVGVFSSDVSLIRLSKLISKEKPYPNSYFMMIDKDGSFFIHPDSTKLFTHTLFDGADPRRQADIVALGHDMTAGNEGHMAVNINGEPCLVYYKPVPGTSWSLAVVCPDSDILAGYHKQTYIVLPLLILGILAILVLCHRVVAHVIAPLNQLVVKTQSIAEGNMEVYIPRTQRSDAVGRLQNSFATMLQSLNFHLGSVRYTTEQAKARNKELMKAMNMAKEAERQKTIFIQNVCHQVRTPLNIIMGFAQVLRSTAATAGGSAAEGGWLTAEEMKNITKTMNYNSKLLNRLVKMLYDSSETGLDEELKSQKHDLVSCNDVARQTIDYIGPRFPNFTIQFKSDVADDFCIVTNRTYLMHSLSELLYNSAKYSDGMYALLYITRATMTVCEADAEGKAVNKTVDTVRFIIEDIGKGIAEADRDHLFKFFTKVDELSEGLGLGLPLSKRHATNLGGDLSLDTSYRDGCRFVFELPVGTDRTPPTSL